jgi:hypothetical protein
LVCQPSSHDILILPTGQQAGAGALLAGQAYELWGRQGTLAGGLWVVRIRPDSETPAGCASLTMGGPEPKQPEPIERLDWEAPIPERHRPAEVPPHPWQAAAPCAADPLLLIVQDRTAEYSRLQERGTKMQLALRGQVQTAPCKLVPGSYTYTWRAHLEHAPTTHAQLQVSVWAHPPGYPPRLLSTRLVSGQQEWARYDEPFDLLRGMPVSLEIQWLDGPSYPVLVDRQPEVALTLAPKVQLRAGTWAAWRSQ